MVRNSRLSGKKADSSVHNGLAFANDMNETPPQKRSFGYARVSTTGQTLAAQLGQLTAAGCSTTYQEQASGARADRRELQRLLKALEPETLSP